MEEYLKTRRHPLTLLGTMRYLDHSQTSNRSSVGSRMVSSSAGRKKYVEGSKMQELLMKKFAAFDIDRTEPPAAVSFPWGSSQINLVDTPGHIDFTMEVEQSLAVLDGAVVVLDASAGVEAQTLTVWRQAAGYRVPRLLYLNKMDRSDADEVSCVKSIEEKLDATPLLLHTPVRHEGKLIGLLDLLNLEEIIWTQGRGQKYTRRKLTEKEDGHVWENTMTGHRHLVDTISSLDDNLADIIIQEESLDNIQSKDITAAIRRCTIDMKGFPIVCGSSYKNIGVQTLMDAVVDYLPSPDQCNELGLKFLLVECILVS
ncbi:unnamed protein product [Plutella xylostella]|uniref:(diamondback moth) hypothetical protein n=1 Tax=Plutella xylostella TaxID=51655 RepID=A0A8S4GFS7_PLUXY|nr:unnamed protein product [Plutella xylostella]